MATFIVPGDERTWEQTFPEIETDPQAAANCEGALMLIASYMTRGKLTATVAVNRILRAEMSVQKEAIEKYPDVWATDGAWADIARRLYYCVRIAETKPKAWQKGRQ